ncbi:hypothetical protein TWF694_009619 [Orbilia ellipsospora]|uniref:Uncharacterized protein n=1 Tax=Orbilia ellipsospora TaxID=2528407 RepID=A0AAV9XBC7_9PEZI
MEFLKGNGGEKYGVNYAMRRSSYLGVLQERGSKYQLNETSKIMKTYSQRPHEKGKGRKGTAHSPKSTARGLEARTAEQQQN